MRIDRNRIIQICITWRLLRINAWKPVNSEWWRRSFVIERLLRYVWMQIQVFFYMTWVKVAVWDVDSSYQCCLFNSGSVKVGYISCQIAFFFLSLSFFKCKHLLRCTRYITTNPCAKNITGSLNKQWHSHCYLHIVDYKLWVGRQCTV